VFRWFLLARAHRQKAGSISRGAAIHRASAFVSPKTRLHAAWQRAFDLGSYELGANAQSAVYQYRLDGLQFALTEYTVTVLHKKLDGAGL
jgi:hypothetical protein